MAELHEFPAIIERQWQILSTEYGKLYNRSSYDQLVMHLGFREPAVFEEAIHNHISDTTEEAPGKLRGKWPPKIADIVAQLQKLEDALRIQQKNRDFESNRTYEALSEDGERPPLPRSNCQECSDRGMTAFYYMPRDKSKVWLQSEALRLDAPLFALLTTASCLCDCKVGFNRREREWTYVDDNGSSRPTIPRLETIRYIAKRRRDKELPQLSKLEPQDDQVVQMVEEFFS